MNRYWKTTFKLGLLLIAVMFLTGQSCAEREAEIVHRTQHGGYFKERGTVRVLEAIRKEIVLFREECSCECSAKGGR